LILLGEEARRLQADDKVLLSDDLGHAFTDLGAVAHAPDLHLPAGEVLRHGEGDFGDAVLVGGQRGIPVGGVGEVFADGGFDDLASAATLASAGALAFAAAGGLVCAVFGIAQSQAIAGFATAAAKRLSRSSLFQLIPLTLFALAEFFHHR